MALALTMAIRATQAPAMMEEARAHTFLRFRFETISSNGREVRPVVFASQGMALQPERLRMFSIAPLCSWGENFGENQADSTSGRLGKFQKCVSYKIEDLDILGWNCAPTIYDRAETGKGLLTFFPACFRFHPFPRVISLVLRTSWRHVGFNLSQTLLDHGRAIARCFLFFFWVIANLHSMQHGQSRSDGP